MGESGIIAFGFDIHLSMFSGVYAGFFLRRFPFRRKGSSPQSQIRRHKTVTPLTLNIDVDRPLQRQPWPLDKLGLSFFRCRPVRGNLSIEPSLGRRASSLDRFRRSYVA
jgi:hypothetical protein